MLASNHTLENLFRPASVAVIGASTSPDKFGHIIIDMLLTHGFRGAVYPINPKASEICGLPAYPSLAAAPDPIDLAVIALPAESVLPAFHEVISKRVANAVVISSGFAETAAGSQLQEDLAALSRESGVRLVGPNCEGLVNLHDNIILTFSPALRDLPRPGPVSYVSQSGAYAGIVARRLSQAGVGFCKIISSGNEADVTATELFEYFATDPSTGVITAYLEQIRQPRQFLALMRRVTSIKPVVINKAGASQGGQQAAKSHTGAIASSDRVIDAVFLQCGIVRAKHIEEMVDMVAGLATQPMLRGNRLALLTTAGGLAVEAADLCEDQGFRLPALNAGTCEKLTKIVPYYGQVENPVDMTASALRNHQWPAACVALVASDSNVDAILVLLTAIPDIRTAEHLKDAISASTKPILLCWTASELAPETRSYLLDNGIPIYPTPYHAMNALRGLQQRGRYMLGEAFQS